MAISLTGKSTTIKRTLPHGSVRFVFQTSAAGYAPTGTSCAVFFNAGPVYFSICSCDIWPQFPCARLEEPTSKVRQLTLPFLHSDPGCDGSAGSNHAPSLMRTTPSRTLSVITAPTRICPRSLKARTRSPSLMPRALASFGWIQMASRSATAYFLRSGVLSS